MFIIPLLGFTFKRQIGYGKNYKLLAIRVLGSYIFLRTFNFIPIINSILCLTNIKLVQL